MNTASFQPESAISGDSPEDTRSLKDMAKGAREYISSFSWCPPIKELFLARGVGDVVAAFVVHFTQRIRDRDEFLWVIVGDLPSAFLVIDRCKTAGQALQAYCDLMQEWSNAVLEHRELSGIFPVQAQPTAENATLLEKRVRVLRERIIPLFTSEKHTH
jgi:hypothetical protein